MTVQNMKNFQFLTKFLNILIFFYFYAFFEFSVVENRLVLSSQDLNFVSEKCMIFKKFGDFFDSFLRKNYFMQNWRKESTDFLFQIFQNLLFFKLSQIFHDKLRASKAVLAAFNPSASMRSFRPSTWLAANIPVVIVVLTPQDKISWPPLNNL